MVFTAEISPLDKLQQSIEVDSIFLVSDTHDDANWMATNAIITGWTRSMAAEVVDRLEANPDLRFSFESQWMAEAYLKSADLEETGRFRKLVAEGRLYIAPSRALLDEQLSGEWVTMMNLIVGQAEAKRLGLKSGTVAGPKDVFGLGAQIPQIYGQLGVEAILQARGWHPELEDRVVYDWYGLDGQIKVAAIRQAEGYGSAVRLGHNPVDASSKPYLLPRNNPPQKRRQVASDEIQKFLNSSQPYVESGIPGIMYHGCDYERFGGDIDQVIEELRQDFPEVSFEFGTYQDIARSVNGTHHPAYQGDLIGPQAYEIRDVDYTNIPGVKVPFSHARQTLLTAETLNAFAAYSGMAYDNRPEIREIWKTLLFMGTHDSISACVPDKVMKEFAWWHELVENGSQQITRMALSWLTAKKESRYNHRPITGQTLSVVNPLPYPDVRHVQIPVPPNLHHVAGFSVIDANAGHIPSEVSTVDGHRYIETIIPVDGYDQTPFSIIFKEEPSPAQETINSRFETNNIIAETMAGGLVLTDKNTGQSNKIWLEIGRDQGDAYTLDPVDGSFMDSRDLSFLDSGSTLHMSELKQSLTHSFSVSLPKKVGGNSEGMVNLTMALEEIQCLDHVNLHVIIDNPEIENLIVRVAFSLPDAGGKVLAKDNGYVRSYAVGECPRYFDPNIPEAFYAFDAEGVQVGNLAMAARGLYGHRIDRRQEGLVLTKLIQRGTGWISREAPRKRPNAAASIDPIIHGHNFGTNVHTLHIKTNPGFDENGLVRFSQKTLTESPHWVEGVDFSNVPKVLEGNAVISHARTDELGRLVFYVGNYGSHDSYLRFDRPVTLTRLNGEVDVTDNSATNDRSFVSLKPYQLRAVVVD